MLLIGIQANCRDKEPRNSFFTFVVLLQIRLERLQLTDFLKNRITVLGENLLGTKCLTMWLPILVSNEFTLIHRSCLDCGDLLCMQQIAL